ncbi:MAG: nicotinate phosphoribosyltransferase [Ruminococcus sp.]|uniref:Nicotinate phosphoribosyltransferase n=1 Tax=Schaedlerella arabinosiphila TaxID=2044587 RepID=A0A3R8JR28_9FIRM|nr:nicotinate phosphoribosyltransferase [Schaedlerella arabinosiphila]MCI8723056.1 nicotinate phosphoribosyltransferase [Ruminococcus sp.]MCI9211687.1 nicotinate phosphoribosyltransferase [Ruminococcus sp.]MCI9602665.1 nicotinate phosphoribosyltransferase [Ruminococcus sp.]RRK33296.1 nicotinate phosphoribosyltransferase [Schaedlerella arabinosiphila]
MRTQNLTLLTDLYELTMMQGYYETQENETVVFDVFFRENPDKGGYSVMAGLEQVIEYIKNLNFSYDDVDYFRKLGIFSEDFLQYLSGFHFSGSIYAIPEGTVIFPKEPLLKVIAPIMEAQLVETAILNIINHQSLIATKASRVVYAAQGDGIMEFGLRRAQGPDAGLYGARAAVIGGCVGTSNVLAGQMFDVPIMGTHAHSWIMSFKDEYTAFKEYAKLYPHACTLLVDTYDTLKSGVPNAIRVFREMREEGIHPRSYGIRLDSGDLAYLSKKARKMLDDAGFPDAVIAASNDLDEMLIHDLKMQGAKITSWGVGTNLITSKGCPSFGGVYKLAAIRKPDGEFAPKIKISENTEKITNPGNKTIFRVYDKETGKIRADLICFADETFDTDQDLLLFDPNATWKKTRLPGGSYRMQEILKPVFVNGECVYESPSVMEIAAYCRREKETLWDETKRLFYPHRVYVDLSQKLYDTKEMLLNEMSK